MSEDRIRSLSCWQGPISLEPLGGGLTNLNYRVRDAEGSFVVRLCEDKSDLGIDRRSERICQEAAARRVAASERSDGPDSPKIRLHDRFSTRTLKPCHHAINHTEGTTMNQDMHTS